MEKTINITTELENSTARKLFNGYLNDQFDNAKTISEKFDNLTRLYFEVNSVINISALRTIDDIYTKHYLDSIYPHKYFVGTVCDIGCGGGFPTIPIAITTDCEVTGVDSVGKKLLLIKRCIGELPLKNLKCEYARSEDLVKLHRSYDTVCARALSDVEKSITYCAPLVKPHGILLLYRTKNDEPAKQKTLDKYNIVLSNTVDYVLPNTDINRRLLIYTKK